MAATADLGIFEVAPFPKTLLEPSFTNMQRFMFVRKNPQFIHISAQICRSVSVLLILF